jgi:hypothetical protein
MAASKPYSIKAGVSRAVNGGATATQGWCATKLAELTGIAILLYYKRILHLEKHGRLAFAD